MESTKPVHTLVLDAGGIIKNDPSVSTLLAQSESLVTVPAIISEIKDANTRARVETTLQPFLTIRSPNPASMKFVTDFARRTGDLAVLSKPDLQIIALTYEIECERNGGDWRLRKAPGQKGVNGAPPPKPATDEESTTGNDDAAPKDEPTATEAPQETSADASTKDANAEPTVQEPTPEASSCGGVEVSGEEEQLSQAVQEVSLEDETAGEPNDESAPAEEESDGEGWITPSNLKKQQAKDAAGSTSQTPEPKTMQVAVLTSDYAMQNVILQINLNLLSPALTRIKQLKTFVLRCHACFQVSKDMSKQFCPRCGQPSLTRVSCSTSANGEFKLHLKKNMQWNTRGDRFSIPKPVHGSSNGRIVGGGKNHWGHNLILAEDQKEFERANEQEKRYKERSLMDEDYLPGILTGDRRRQTGKIKVGAGRNVNSRKR